MRQFIRESAKWCLGAALLAGAIGVGTDGSKPVHAGQPTALTPAQQAEEKWLGEEAKRKVAEQNWTTVTLTRANLSTLDAFGTCTRKLSNGTTLNRSWIVKFIIVGSGSTRKFQAQAPIYN